uniref:Putative secreted protein n=1 Tax=Anopheles triannulatus TaxID=58253 RepID=A0A2M4B539_9DIPT
MYRFWRSTSWAVCLMSSTKALMSSGCSSFSSTISGTSGSAAPTFWLPFLCIRKDFILCFSFFIRRFCRWMCR